MRVAGPERTGLASVESLLRERDRDAAARNAAARAIVVKRPEHPGLDPMPFIVGVPRSGTTLLRTMLDSHPSLAIPMETGFLPQVFDLAWEASRDLTSEGRRSRFQALLTGFSTWEHMGIDANDLSRALAELEPFDFTDGLRAFYGLCAALDGKSRSGDKTPLYARHLPVVEALLPESHFIHIVRDGRDVYLSARNAPWSVVRHWFPFGREVETLAAQWRRDIMLCRRLAVTSRHFMELRYEDLLDDPAGQLERICRFIDLPYEEAMLEFDEQERGRFHEKLVALLEGYIDSEGTGRGEREEVSAWVDRTRLGAPPVDPAASRRWREEMSRQDVEAFEAVAGDVLARYDYELAASPPGG
jgi:hypothetical protein